MLTITSKIEGNGISVSVDGHKLKIVYPRDIWRAYPDDHKEVFRDNVALSSTFFVPQILHTSKIFYKSSRPASESFLFKNGIYDMSNSAHTDKNSSVSYIKRFLNTAASFEGNKIRLPNKTRARQPHANNVVITFTFGKDSLLTAAVAEELGLDSRLVYFAEPSHLHEYKHKKALIQPFTKSTGKKVCIIENGPGAIRYGRLWNKNTELGWGIQTTEYVLLSLPLLHYWDALYITLGNERSCREADKDSEGVLTHWTAYDQHPDWTPQQGLLASLLLGRTVEVMSLVEPLHELAEIAVLYKRYPKYANFQASCLADAKQAKNNRWCQKCEKCTVMYSFLKAVGVDVRTVGFTENLFDSEHFSLFKNLFFPTGDSNYYAVFEELFLAFYLARCRGERGKVLDFFSDKILPSFKRQIKKHFEEFLGVHSSVNIPGALKLRTLKIYESELKKVRQGLKGYLK